MKKVVIIDGQGGRMGRLLIERIRGTGQECEIQAIGTNSIATAAMLKAGADAGATGENPVIVACRDADVILGPVGIVIADSLQGEVTPAMAAAVGQSRARRLLLPVDQCGNVIAGVRELSMAQLIDEAVRLLEELM